MFIGRVDGHKYVLFDGRVCGHTYIVRWKGVRAFACHGFFGRADVHLRVMFSLGGWVSICGLSLMSGFPKRERVGHQQSFPKYGWIGY